jgi:hypothetical protein
MKKNKDMLQNKKPYNEQGQRHGHWVWLRTDGSIMLIADYVNDVPLGYMEYHKQFVFDCIEPIDYEYYAR